VGWGGQNWQEATVWESIVPGVGGSDFYTKALIQADPDALGSATMVKCFDTLRMVLKYIDKDAPGRDWNLATSMVIQGKAGMQFMGDWAKGEFKAAGKNFGTDYIAMPVPETSNGYLFNVDSFISQRRRGPKSPESHGPPNPLSRVSGGVQHQQRLHPGPFRNLPRSL
jgi:glucose/mannose transport system substrate-binding protein